MADSIEFNTETLAEPDLWSGAMTDIIVDGMVVGVAYDAESDLTFFRPEPSGIIGILVALMETGDPCSLDIMAADGSLAFTIDGRPEFGAVSITMADGSAFDLMERDGVFLAAGLPQDTLRTVTEILDGLSNTFTDLPPDDSGALTSQELYDSYILPHMEQDARTADDPEAEITYNEYLPSFTGGVFVAAGDVDGDGRDDVLIFMPKTAEDGAVTPVAVAGFLGGVRVAVGDVNDDGLDDAVVRLSTGESFIFSDGAAAFACDGEIVATDAFDGGGGIFNDGRFSPFEDAAGSEEIYFVGERDPGDAVFTLDIGTVETFDATSAEFSFAGDLLIAG